MYVILLFSGVVGSIWGARKREKQSANPILSPTRFCYDFGIILGGIVGAKPLSRIDVDFERFLGGFFGVFSVHAPPTMDVEAVQGGCPGR